VTGDGYDRLFDSFGRSWCLFATLMGKCAAIGEDSPAEMRLKLGSQLNGVDGVLAEDIPTFT
jgi:hypothetical protein